MWVTEDDVVTDLGDHITYGIVHKEPFSIIIPWDGEKTLLVGQYRYAVDFFSWEFPMGHSEPSHSNLEETAQRELEEETGLSAAYIQKIGTFYLGSGHHTQKGYVFVTTQHTQGDPNREPAEKDMQLKWVTPYELSSLIENGTIQDGPTITSFKFFELYQASNAKKSPI